MSFPWSNAFVHGGITSQHSLRLSGILARAMLPLGPGKSGSNHPAFVACLTGLLRWPDRDQAQHLPQGYPSVGEVEPCGVFQKIHQSDKAGITTWSAGAVDLQRLLRSPPPKNADVILTALPRRSRKIKFVVNYSLLLILIVCMGPPNEGSWTGF